MPEKIPDDRVTDALELTAVVLVVVGVALWSIPVALIIAGVAVWLVAHPVTLPRRWRS